MDRSKFYDAVRTSLFAGKLSHAQVEGMDAVLNEWEAEGLTDQRWLAYMLATDYHETGKTMQPIREAYAESDEQAISILESSYKRGRLPWVKTPYWRKDEAGHSWFGRGLVQLTHRANYEKFGLADHPEKALEMPTAVKVMFVGMRNGMFSGKKLSDYFHGDTADWVNARRIINGVDRANDIAGYGKKFLAAIEAAS
jgi:predicted chitinase